MILLLFLILLLPGRIASDFSGKDTEIFVIGTVHYNTSNFNSDTLLKILNKINPDLILLECDSSYMTSNFQLNDDIKDSFLETEAVSRYLAKKKVDIRPFDISGRDDYLNSDKRLINETNFFNEVNMLSQTENLNVTAKNILKNILSMMNTADELSNSTLGNINSSEGSRKIDTINYYTYKGIRNLINSLPELSKYKSYWDEEYDFWEKRNQTMLKNILKFTKSYSGKKIVVLCGFAHKNLLVRGLKKSSHSGKDKLIINDLFK